MSTAIRQPSRTPLSILRGRYLSLDLTCLLQTLGEGELAKVKLGIHPSSGAEVAVKLIRKGNTDKVTQAEREIEVLKVRKFALFSLLTILLFENCCVFVAPAFLSLFDFSSMSLLISHM
jgi:serine/threonine protein kinase